MLFTSSKDVKGVISILTTLGMFVQIIYSCCYLQIFVWQVYLCKSRTRFAAESFGLLQLRFTSLYLTPAQSQQFKYFPYHSAKSCYSYLFLKLPGSVVADHLIDFPLRVHDKRPMLHDRLIERAAH